MTDPSPRATLWALTLAGAAILGSLATACMMPFVAVAVLAAATMPRGSAVVTVLGAWGANQLLGFGLLGYPWDGGALAWGLALGAATLIVALAAGHLFDRSPATPWVLPVVFVAGFALFEVLLFGFALVAGGTGTFTPAIVTKLFVNDALWFAGLAALRAVLTRAAPAFYPQLSRV